MSPLQSTCLRKGPAPCRGGLEMADRGERRDDDTGACDAGTPGEVDVLTEHRNLVVEAADNGEQVGAHEHAPAGNGEHLASLVVLRLIELSPFDAANGCAEAVHVETELQDSIRLVFVDELWTDNPGVRPERLLRQSPDGVRFKDHVVVTEQKERRALGEAEDRVGARAVATVLVQAGEIETGGDGRDTRRE